MDTQAPGAPERTRLHLADGMPGLTMALFGAYFLVIALVPSGMVAAFFGRGFVDAFRRLGRYLDIEGLRYIHKRRSTTTPARSAPGRGSSASTGCA